MSHAEAFWESFYAEGRSRWSGAPNASLVAEAGDLAPGTALDLGCGEGGDAIWLATRGWRVTGADVSASALAAAARHAAAAGVGERIAWERRDLAASMPAGRFDLVCASYLHSPVELPRAAVLRRAAAAVAPGGQLLVIGHLPSEAHPELAFRRPGEELGALALPDGEWVVRTCAERTVMHAFAGEDVAKERADGVLRVQRRAG